MSADRIGTGVGAVLAQLTVDENTRTGSVTTYHYIGSYDECLAKRLEGRTIGASEISFRSRGDGDWEYTSSFPKGENGVEPVPTPNQHELEVNTVQASWKQNLVLRSMFNSPDLFIGITGKVIENYQAGKYEPADSSDPAAETAALGDLDDRIIAAGGNADDEITAHDAFVAVALRGSDSFVEEYNVYRRTLTAATPSEVTASYVGAGLIWTTDEVMAYENLDPLGFFVLETGMLWRKSKPHVICVAHQKTQVQYSYTGEKQWSRLYYKPYGAAVLI